MLRYIAVSSSLWSCGTHASNGDVRIKLGACGLWKTTTKQQGRRTYGACAWGGVGRRVEEWAWAYGVTGGGGERPWPEHRCRCFPLPPGHRLQARGGLVLLEAGRTGGGRIGRSWCGGASLRFASHDRYDRAELLRSPSLNETACLLACAWEEVKGGGSAVEPPPRLRLPPNNFFSKTMVPCCLLLQLQSCLPVCRTVQKFPE